MICFYCNGKGKIKVPREEDKEEFELLVDRELDKGYAINRIMAEKKIINKFKYLTIDCPHCQKTN